VGGTVRPSGVAVVGCGAWGQNIARCLAELDVLAAVVDHHPGNAKAAADRVGAPARPLDDVLADPSVAAVAIATQPRHHHPIGLAALAAGKHLFVEKPLTLDLGEARALIAAARARRRILMVGHLLRYHPAFVALADLVAAGRLGRILRLRAARLNLGRVRSDEDALWCLAPHDVSMALALVGGPPTTVETFAAHPLGRPIADAVVVQLGFATGATALIEASWLHPVKEQRLTVIGSEGMAVFDDCAPWERKLTLHRHRVGTGATMAGEAAPVPLDPTEPLRLELAHFLDSVHTGREPTTGSDEALAVMNVLARAALAMEREPRRAEAR
jgi:predicted dehydrogenase